MAKQLQNGNVLCEQCGKEYKKIGNHWFGKSCNHPKLDDVTKEIIIGLLMGDGSISNREEDNQRIIVGMIAKQFLEWLDNKFGWLSTGVSIHQTAKELANNSRKTGFDISAKEDNYNDYYSLCTRSHPFITSLTKWYKSGSKLWPDSIEITPTILLMLYVGDGHYCNNDYHRRIQIGMKNEVDNKNKIHNYFIKQKLPTPSIWNNSEPYWTVKGSYELFDYMSQSPLWNGPPPGFEYKFPENFGGTGKDMSDLAQDL